MKERDLKIKQTKQNKTKQNKTKQTNKETNKQTNIDAKKLVKDNVLDLSSQTFQLSDESFLKEIPATLKE